MEWLLQWHMKTRVPTASRAESPQWATCNDPTADFVNGLVSSLKHNSPEKELTVTVFSPHSRGEAAPSTSSAKTAAVVTPIPVSIESFATSLRMSHQQRPGPRFMGETLLPVDTRGEKLLADTSAFLCPLSSHDFMLCEVTNTTTDTIENCVAVAAHSLTPLGSLLVVFPDRPPGNSLTCRNIEWLFRECTWGRVPQSGIHYLYCKSISCENVGRAVDRKGFPGFLRRGQRRERRWNPYVKRKRAYCASLRPAFTNASVTRDALKATLEHQKGEEEKLSQEAEKYFNVSYDMVEKRSHYSPRDN